MNDIVDVHINKFVGGLQSLHNVDHDTLNWLFKTQTKIKIQGIKKRFKSPKTKTEVTKTRFRRSKTKTRGIKNKNKIQEFQDQDSGTQ